jgi:hypothetical protein
MNGFRVEYNLHLGLAVGAGWATHDPTFDTVDEAASFRDTLARMDRAAEYRVVNMAGELIYV